MNKKNTLDNVTSTQYDEAAALQQLLQSLDAVDIEDDSEQIVITIANTSTAFIVGGPQIEAICRFCKQIADENGYTIDFDNSIVIDE